MEYNFRELNKKLKRILQGNPLHETISKEEQQYVERKIYDIVTEDGSRKSVDYTKLLKESETPDMTLYILP